MMVASVAVVVTAVVVVVVVVVDDDDDYDAEVFKSQDANGKLGLTAAVRMSVKPVEIMQNYPTIKIVSGNEHLVCLTWKHDIFTLGMNIGAASVRQDEAIASFSCNCVLVSSVKCSLNTAPKCSILRSDNKNTLGGV